MTSRTFVARRLIDVLITIGAALASEPNMNVTNRATPKVENARATIGDAVRFTTLEVIYRPVVTANIHAISARAYVVATS